MFYTGPKIIIWDNGIQLYPISFDQSNIVGSNYRIRYWTQEKMNSTRQKPKCVSPLAPQVRALPILWVLLKSFPLLSNSKPLVSPYQKWPRTRTTTWPHWHTQTSDSWFYAIVSPIYPHCWFMPPFLLVQYQCVHLLGNPKFTCWCLKCPSINSFHG